MRSLLENLERLTQTPARFKTDSVESWQEVAMFIDKDPKKSVKESVLIYENRRVIMRTGNVLN